MHVSIGERKLTIVGLPGFWHPCPWARKIFAVCGRLGDV